MTANRFSSGTIFVLTTTKKDGEAQKENSADYQVISFWTGDTVYKPMRNIGGKEKFSRDFAVNAKEMREHHVAHIWGRESII